MKKYRQIVPLGSHTPILEEYDDAVPSEGGESIILSEEIHGKPRGDDELLESPAEDSGGLPSVQTETPSEPAEDTPARKGKSRRADK